MGVYSIIPIYGSHHVAVRACRLGPKELKGLGFAGTRVLYLLFDELENCILLCLTDADGVQNLTSFLQHFIFSQIIVVQFARVVILVRVGEANRKGFSSLSWHLGIWCERVNTITKLWDKDNQLNRFVITGQMSTSFVIIVLTVVLFVLKLTAFYNSY